MKLRFLSHCFLFIIFNSHFRDATFVAHRNPWAAKLPKTEANRKSPPPRPDLGQKTSSFPTMPNMPAFPRSPALPSRTLFHQPLTSSAVEQVVLYPSPNCSNADTKINIPILDKGCQQIPTFLEADKWKYGVKVFTSRSIRFYSNYHCTESENKTIVRIIPPEPKTPSRCNNLCDFLPTIRSFLPLEFYTFEPRLS